MNNQHAVALRWAILGGPRLSISKQGGNSGLVEDRGEETERVKPVLASGRKARAEPHGRSRPEPARASITSWQDNRMASPMVPRIAFKHY